MNKVILMGRLTRDPEMRYGASQSGVARFTIAVDRRFKREGQPDADFFNCVSFGKTAEFVDRYLHKGTKIVLDGEVHNDNYTNNKGEKVYSVEISVNSVEFAESKRAAEERGIQTGNDGSSSGSNYGGGGFEPSMSGGDGFVDIDGVQDSNIPF